MPRLKRPSLAVQGGLWLDRQGKQLVGASRIELLEAIDRLGSITQAARAVGISYKAAWDSVDAMHNLAEQPLLVRATGGPHGGGSHLTAHGRELVRLYRLLETGYQRLLLQMQTHVHDFPKLNELIKAITMRTSARNQYRGKITSVRRGAVNADVVLDIGDGVSISANITNDAVEELSLKPGRDAVALIKSSFVLLTPDADTRVSARNKLRGCVSQIIPGAVNAEVKLKLAGERVLTAVITLDALEELNLVVGTPCTALVKASHVLIAVND